MMAVEDYRANPCETLHQLVRWADLLHAFHEQRRDLGPTDFHRRSQHGNVQASALNLRSPLPRFARTGQETTAYHRQFATIPKKDLTGTPPAYTYSVRCHFWGIMTFAIALLNARGAQDVPIEMPFEFREGLLWVKATLSQSSEPLSFLLDSGAGASVINRSTANRLGLKRGSAVTVRGVESTFTGHRLKDISAFAGDVSLPVDYLEVDLSRLSGSCERPVDGLLGADFFRGHAVQVDFQALKLRILKPDQVPTLGEVLPLQIRSCGMCVPITVNGHQWQWVRLDTGCVSALQWVTSHVRPQECKPQVAIGLAEISIPQTQATVEIGQQQFANVPTGLHAKAIFAGEAGLLGNGLLCRFSKITIDTKARRLILEINPPTR